MTVRSTLRLPAAHALACSTVAVCALMGAMASSVARADETASAAVASAARAGSAATQYTVKPGQSLNDIAIAATQSHDPAVLARTAKVIFDANPSAFMRGNSSRMKVGAVLKVPPLEASGAVMQAPAAPASAPTGAAASAAASGAVSIGAVAAATGSAAHSAASVTAATAAPVSGAAHAVAPAAQNAGASSTVAASSAAQTAPHLQTGVAMAGVATPMLAGESGEHAWAGSIQAAASGPVQAAASDANGTAAVELASSGSSASAAAAPVVRAASAATAAPVAGASASGAPHARFSSLQQLLALKNHVLMDLQRHGFGAQPPHAAAGNTSSVASGPSAATTAKPGSAPRAALPRSPAHEPMVGHSTADERFIGAGGYGFHVSRASIPTVAAIASAAVAALLVLIVGFAVAGRKRRADRAATVAGGTAPSGAAADQQTETPSERRLADADAPTQDPLEAQFLEMLARTPTSKRALMGLAAHYAECRNVRAFNGIAEQIRGLSGGRGPNWQHIASLGSQLDPDNPLYALSDEGAEEEETPSDEGEGNALPAHSAGAQQQADQSGPEPAATEAPPPPVTAESVPPDTSFPADAVDALNELDMALPPRVEGQAQPDEAGVALERTAMPPEAPHDASQEAEAGLNARERGAAQAQGADAPHADDTARSASAAPAAVSGLGAARFGALNLAFDLDLPGAGNGTPATVATPAQPMFSPEEIAKIARNKIELAAEYIALGDFGGARTLIHEVIESNDPGTRDEAHALLATLAPLS